MHLLESRPENKFLVTLVNCKVIAGIRLFMNKFIF